MRKRRIFGLGLMAPLISTGLLAGVVAQNRGHVEPGDANAYHARAKEAIEEVPYIIGSWMGRDEAVPEAAVKLLNPNIILSRTYVDTQEMGVQDRRVGLLIVQTRETRDMVGHYPPVCYVSNGLALVGSKRRTWEVGGVTIPGMEYEFTRRVEDQVYRTVIYNFLIVPGKTGIVADMKGIYKSVGDYQQRYFGAAQFQVVFSGATAEVFSPEQRDEVFTQLIGANVPAIRTLLAGGVR